jgi:hypothetical protein
VATGAPALRRFPVITPGPVLLYAAEDPAHAVRQRLLGISEAAGVDFDTLDLHVITAPTLRLDLAEDRARLQATVARLRPKLLVLDPFVRLHRIDENAAAEVAPLLGFLRGLQRRYATAVHLAVEYDENATHPALRGRRMPCPSEGTEGPIVAIRLRGAGLSRRLRPLTLAPGYLRSADHTHLCGTNIIITLDSVG